MTNPSCGVDYLQSRFYSYRRASNAHGSAPPDTNESYIVTAENRSVTVKYEDYRRDHREFIRVGRSSMGQNWGHYLEIEKFFQKSRVLDLTGRSSRRLDFVAVRSKLMRPHAEYEVLYVMNVNLSQI